MNEHPTITALRATAPHAESPLPWSQTPHSMGIGVECASDDGNEFVGETFYAADAAHIAAAVNAAPVLLAEVDALLAQVAAAREAVAHLDDYWHERDQSACRCGSNNDSLTAARRALGLGGRQCLT